MDTSINKNIELASQSAVQSKADFLTKLNLNRNETKPTDEEKGKILKAAKGFEAIFINMMLKEMKKAMLEEKENDITFGADTLEGYTDLMFAEQVASINGGIGIADMIYEHFTGERLKPQIQKREIVNLDYRYPKPIENKIKESIEKLNSEFKSRIPEYVSERISQYKEIIKRAGEKFGIPESLIEAVIAAESAGKNNAVSRAGAKGLMQLMDGTAKNLGVRNPFDPEQNIMGGTLYLRQMLDKFDGDIELALAAYNAGPGNVTKYAGIPPFKETKAYIQRIKRYLNGDIDEI